MAALGALAREGVIDPAIAAQAIVRYDIDSEAVPARVATMKEVRVPDIGDFEDVPVIEVLVSPGDTVAVEDPLVALESDKASDGRARRRPRA